MGWVESDYGRESVYTQEKVLIPKGQDKAVMGENGKDLRNLA